MRYALITIIATFMNLFASCRPAGDGEKTVAKLAELYNKKDYPALYQMLSPDFRAQATEAQITEFYSANLGPLGNIISWKALPGNAGAQNFTVQFVNGALDLTLYMNEKNEIAGMQWLPAKQSTGTKKDASSIKTNNPKQTKLQLLVDSIAIGHLQNPVNCGLSIGIIDGDKTEMYFYGSTTKEIQKLPDANTLYEIGSITKTFTGILLAHAINEGRITLEDDITKYLSGTFTNLQYNGSAIRIKHLTTHTSGLPPLPANLEQQQGYDVQDPYKHYTKQMMLEYLKTVQLKAAPGTVNEYSNFAVALLGMILENVYKQPIDKLVKAYITTPAQMTDTRFSITVSDEPKMATGYNEQGDKAHYWDLGVFNAAGGLKSNLADMIRYTAANMKEINTDFKLAHEQVYKDPKMSVGLNWILQPTRDGLTLIWHNGGTGGFTSFCGYIKEKNVGIVVLNNSAVNVDALAIGILKELKNGK